MRLVSLGSALALLFVATAAHAADQRPLSVDDLLALKSVGAPVLSPDGAQVAYTVRSMDPKKDSSDTDIYLISTAGGEAVRLTTSPKPETHPRFSPDGRWIAFLSEREGDKTQVWLLPRDGGEASRLTDMKGGVTSFAWSPDSKRLVLVASDPDPDEPPSEEKGEDKKTARPIVTRRIQFMRDGQGYLREIRTHLHVFDVERKTSVQITSGPYDDDQPAWSPDGKKVAFVSNRSAEPDTNRDTNIHLIAPIASETPRALTTNPSQDERPSWSPDGQTLARTPEAKGLDGRSFFPPELPADTKKRLDDNLHAAMEDFVRNPDDAQNIIWVGRRLGYLSRYREAIEVFSRGILKLPNDARLLRHRAHRYISTRQFDKAIVDFEKASKLMAGRLDEGEPDGSPGRRPSPSSTLKFNIYYHLGLAHYLKGDFAKALAAYRECMKYSHDNDDSLVATSDWLYMTLRRLGRKEEAQKVLEPIREGMDVLDNAAYYQRLLLYKGLRLPEDVLGNDEQDPLQIATQGYGVGNFYLVNGDTERAKAIYRRVVAGSQWSAFGFIAAEADLARMK